MNRTILEFVDDNGRRVIQEWLGKMKSTTREKVSAALDARLVYLRAEKNPSRPETAPVTGPDSAGLFKLRFKLNKVQYRPIFFYGPSAGEVTLLAGATEKGSQLKPPEVRVIAQRRKAFAMGNRRYVCEYFSGTTS